MATIKLETQQGGGGGGSVSKDYVDEHDLSTLNTGKAYTDEEIFSAKAYADNKLEYKVDKVEGKELSDNNYTDEDVATVANLDEAIVTGNSYTANASTVVETVEKLNPTSGTTSSVENSLPVATATDAGIMTPAIYNSITTNTGNIQAILNGSVAVSGMPASPTQQQVTDAWMTATGLTALINRASVYDTTNNKVWTYYTNTNTWLAATNTTQVSINTWTNSSEGVILGSEADGQIYAEDDGTGSVNGWDALKSAVNGKIDAADLANVAISGSYNDLSNTPSVPVITMTTTDPGEGAPLAANNFIAVYEA